MLEELDYAVAHARHVRQLALELFDQLYPLHELGSDERDMLDAAALLHDIGWTVSDSKHHKHTFHLIRQHAERLDGFSPEQVELIANVARIANRCRRWRTLPTRSSPQSSARRYSASPPFCGWRWFGTAALASGARCLL